MTATTILFAIRATLKLGAAAQEAYIKATREREMILPLALRCNELNSDGANTFFQLPKFRNRFIDGTTGTPHPQAARITELLMLYSTRADFDIIPEAKELIAYCRECKQTLELEKGAPWKDKEIAPGLDADEAMSLATISTWTTDGKTQPKWWKDFGEVLFDIGLEYAMADPRVCNTSTSAGRALKTFLSSLEDIKLTNLKAKDIPGSLLVVTLDAVAANPDILTGGQRGQKMLGTTVKALSQDIDGRLKDCEPIHRDSVRGWGGLVFKSILTSASRLAVENPGAYLGIQGEKSEIMASSVGGALLDIVLKSDSDDINLSEFISVQTLEAVSKAALTVVAQYPELAVKSKDKGIRALIKAMATDVATMDNIYGIAALPDLLRLMLENTGENLELIWPNTKDPGTHLFITAASTTLKALSKKDANDKWSLDFNHTDAVEIVESVFSELKANPSWLVNDPEIQAVLGVVLDQTLEVIRAKGGKELTRSAVKKILASSLHAALSRVEFTERYPATNSTKTFMKACLDVILATAFDEADIKVKCSLTRDASLNVFLEAALAAVGSTTLKSPGDKKKALAALEAVLTQTVDDIKQGKGIDLATLQQHLETKLNEGAIG